MTRAALAAIVARRAYAALLRVHPASRDGYADQMAATFDTLLEPAAARGFVAVGALFAREAAGLIGAARTSRANRTAHDGAWRDDPHRRKRLPMMETIRQDLRYALRTFRKRPGFTTALILTLALGIGANTAIFSVVNAVLLQRLPFTDAGRLVMVWEDASSLGFPRNTPAPGNYADWKSIHAFEDVAAIDQRDFNLVSDSEPEKIGGAGVTANLFSVLGVQPAIGRVWRANEDVPGNHIAVISYGLWQRKFGSDPNVLHTTVSFNGTPYTILGVMPPRFQLLTPDLQVWAPMNFTADDLGNRGDHYLNVVARLRAGNTLAEANAELTALAAESKRAHPATNGQMGMYAVPLLDDYVGDTRAVLFVLLTAVGCVLLVACANIANLLLTGAMGRSREMAVRAALGADRRRLIRQLMTESVLLSIIGGALGIGVARLSFSTLTHLVPEPLADLSRVGFDLRVLSATAAITVLTGVLFGLAPAWRASRVDLGVAGGRRGSRGLVSGPSRLSNALVVGEIALATILLIGAGLFIESFRTISSVDLGFTPDRVLTARIQLPRETYGDFDTRVQFVAAVLDRVRALPGVTMAGYTSAVPLVWKGGTSGFLPEGQARNRSLPYDANNRVVSSGYMETIGMTLRGGRFFDDHDDANGDPVAIINQKMARQYWPGIDPVGRRFRPGAEGPSPRMRTIVGIVDDTCVMGIDQPAKAEMYFPLAQSRTNWMWPRDLAVRSSGDPLSLVAAVRQAVWSVDRTQPISNIKTLDDIVAAELQSRRTQMTLMATFAGLALLLAAIGVYGLLSYSVTSRTKEIGLRLALGGQPSRILALVVRQGMTLAATGLLAGVVIAAWGTSLVGALLFHVSPRDPRTFVLQAAVLVVVCFLAAYIPARRASKADPMAALRVE